MVLVEVDEVDVDVDDVGSSVVAVLRAVVGTVRVVGTTAVVAPVTAPGGPELDGGVGIVTMTTIDCGGWASTVVSATVEPGSLLGIFATASSSFCSS